MSSRQKVRKTSSANLGSNRIASTRPVTANSESDSEVTPSPPAYRSPGVVEISLLASLGHLLKPSALRTSEWNKTHRKCLKILDEAEDDKERLSNLVAQERQQSQQAAQQHRTEKAQLSTQIQHLVADRKQAMEECERVRTENLQLQSRLETATSNANSLNQWPQADMETFLGMIHGDLSTTAARIWGRRDELRNSYLATFSDVLQPPYLQNSGPMGEMGNQVFPSAPLPGTNGAFPSTNPLVPSSGPNA
ncbi:uncharacterized protein N7443_001806 [Penicillium atrosanguineum]|uniref:uncharacterized protein n=1 Tax=Penicillium atrosanguineum TaxID=1132637 RepID=UPI002398F4C4|nr:uncharacterized protein N7443_001806 [Penicillium atrosanguineum]KAJ5309345.1 hypothetical protein N7443_001806 [Penicillium atrosanguineum]